MGLMDERDKRILTALVNNHKMNFQQILDLFLETGELNRTMVHTRLEDLISKEHLIKEANKGERRKGQSRWLSITAEGEKCILNESVAAAAESLKKVRDLTTRIAQQDPEKLNGLRRHLRKVKEDEEDQKKLEKGTLLLEEYLRRFEERTKDDPLRESLKTIYDIYLKVNCLPHQIPKEGFAMAILEKGSVCLLSIALLRKLGCVLREPSRILEKEA